MVKALTIAAAAVAFATTQAPAADLGIPRAPAAYTYPSPTFAGGGFTWTGCYIGGVVGGALSDISFSGGPFSSAIVALSPSSTDVGQAGVLAGGQVGCDLQLSPQWLIGINADADWANISGSQNETVQTTIPGPTLVTSQGTLSAKTNFLATATVQGGFVVGPGFFYAKGGVAWDNNQYSFIGTATTTAANLATFNFSGSDNRIGWTVGVGTEWAITPHFSFNAEYGFMDFGSHVVNFTSASLPSASFNATQHVNELKAGFNFRP